MDQTETTPERPLTRRELRARAAAAADAAGQVPDDRTQGEHVPDGTAPAGPAEEHVPDGDAPDEQAPDQQGSDEQAPDQQGPDQQGPDGHGPDEQGPDERGPDEEASPAAVGVVPEAPDQTEDVAVPAGPDFDPRTGGPGAADETMELPLSALGFDEEGDADDAEAGVPTPPRPWDMAVGWSLRQELPKELPPEPDVDDVHWEPAPAEPMGAQEAEGLGTAAIAGRPVDVTARDGSTAESGPRPEEGTVTDETAGEGAAGEPGDGPGGSATSPSAPSRFSGWPGPAMGVGHAGGPGWSAFPPVASDAEPAPVQPVSASGAAGHEAPAVAEQAAVLPTLTDLLAARPAPPAGPAELGWQATVRRLTGGVIAPAPGRAEQAHRAAVAAVQRSLEGPKTVVVLNPKGGAHKTTATLLIAATFGLHRGGYTLAWDNNETRGTLGWRSRQSRHHNTALNLLQDLDRFADPSSARVGDLDNYVRSQGSAQFDVLASDEDAASAASIDAFAFRSLHRTLSRFYRVMVIDTGNNMRASNWQAAVEAADQVVIVSTVREDTAQSAAWAVDALRATGHEDVVRRAVTVLSAPAPRRDDRLADRLHEHFGRLTRTVLDVPYDPSLVAGRPLDYDALSRQTREAWLQVTAAVADGL